MAFIGRLMLLTSAHSDLLLRVLHPATFRHACPVGFGHFGHLVRVL